MLILKRLFYSGMILCFFACSSQETKNTSGSIAEDYDYEEEILDGVKTITNPAEAYLGRVTLDMTEEITIGVDEGEEPYMLVGPVDVKADKEGRIFVMDWRDIGLRIYDKNGTYIRTLGRKGQGPAEFDSPTYFELSDDGRVFLMDGRNQRITVMDIEGNPQHEFKLRGFHSQLMRDSQNRLYIQNQTPQKEVAVSDTLQEIPMLTTIHRVDSTNGDMFKIGDFEGDKQMMLRTDTGGMMSMSGDHFMWRITPQGRLYVGSSPDYQLQVYSEKGDLEFRFSRKYTPIPNPKARKGMPKNFSAFDVRRPRFDEEGNLWLELNTREEFEGVLYDVFTPEGIYLKQVVVPYRIYHFKNSSAYCLIRTEEEFLQVKRVRLTQNISIPDSPS